MGIDDDSGLAKDIEIDHVAYARCADQNSAICGCCALAELTVSRPPLCELLPWLFGRYVQKIADEGQRSRAGWATSAVTAAAQEIKTNGASSYSDAERVHTR